ncbi:hypothetical protein EVAR_26780_1 [Eumeta japonica]|uniref:Uncharacterized protein n=1 Tax=Eumeta variegata TaxID=151549 RepID=A0A4C1XAM4_EUMVA|nr:hypothetical protein EVAR_26780_1 [Eumeta japonica]
MSLTLFISRNQVATLNLISIGNGLERISAECRARLASSSTDEADCPENMRTTRSANACTSSFPSYRSKESQIEDPKVGSGIELCICILGSIPWKSPYCTPLQRTAQSLPIIEDVLRSVLRREVILRRQQPRHYVPLEAPDQHIFHGFVQHREQTYGSIRLDGRNRPSPALGLS